MRSFFIAAALCLSGCFWGYSQVNGNFTVNADVSYGYMIDSQDLSFSASDPEELKDLRSGLSVDLSAYYMFHPSVGIGLRYNRFSSSASVSDTYINAPNYEYGTGDASEDMTMQYIGVAQIIRHGRRRSFLAYEPTIGYMMYKNKVSALGDDYDVTAKGLGLGFSISYTYNAFENFLIGPRVGAMYTFMSKFQVDGPDGFSEEQDKGIQAFLRFNAGIMVSYTF